MTVIVLPLLIVFLLLPLAVLVVVALTATHPLPQRAVRRRRDE